jgi:aspartyl-tRNA synthetase
MRTLARETVNQVGNEVTIQGWVDGRRDHGKIMFVDVRDRSGIVQVVGSKQMANIKQESVIEVHGVVRTRPESMVNPKMDTGMVEVEAREITVLSQAKELPFPLDTDGYDIKEELRLAYRYLDLRRKRLAKNIRLRSKFVDLVRQYLFSQDFCEIETPMLTKSTPEGSRDFLVPSRIQPGKFYALPQSPQQYKQLLMVAGFERYFQIARCMRDEDLRADRGFEHSQIDVEMSFVNREDVMHMDEGMVTSVLETMGYTIKQKPFPVISYQEAMQKYGADKFDLRTEEDKKNGVLAFCWVVDFPFFEKTDEGSWTFTHNPFSAPKPEHKEWLLHKEHIGDILTTQYDLVCNGYEVGGGSIRSHEAEVLAKVFEVMGYPSDVIQAQFGHMLRAFEFGVPPHGGLAHGVERMMMILAGEPFLREVVAFPQTASGQTSVMDAPSELTPIQLKEIGLSVTPKAQVSVFEQIIAFLKSNKISYEDYEHRAVSTSEEAASIRNTPLHAGAKALVMVGDGKPLMTVIPADLKVDIKRIKMQEHIRDLRMATPEEVENFTGTKIGAVPPLGNLFNMPVFMEEHLRDNEYIYFNAGLHTKSIKMKQSDYEKAVNPIVSGFSKTA